jgi:hypothetical protein
LLLKENSSAITDLFLFGAWRLYNLYHQNLSDIVQKSLDVGSNRRPTNHLVGLAGLCPLWPFLVLYARNRFINRYLMGMRQSAELRPILRPYIRKGRLLLSVKEILGVAASRALFELQPRCPLCSHPKERLLITARAFRAALIQAESHEDEMDRPQHREKCPSLDLR